MRTKPVRFSREREAAVSFDREQILVSASTSPSPIIQNNKKADIFRMPMSEVWTQDTKVRARTTCVPVRSSSPCDRGEGSFAVFKLLLRAAIGQLLDSRFLELLHKSCRQANDFARLFIQREMSRVLENMHLGSGHVLAIRLGAGNDK